MSFLLSRIWQQAAAKPPENSDFQGKSDHH